MSDSETSSSPATEFPPVEPTNFDLIIVGTGLPESIIAAAASTAGKSVLHLDPNPFYGSHFSSLSPSDLSSFLLYPPPYSSPSLLSDEYDAVPLSTRPLYSDVEISPEELENCRRFCLDVSGPRVLFCADSAIELLLKSGVSHYLEFKSVDASLIYDAESGNLSSVPDSRAAIFKDRSLGLTEKTQLMKFFKLVQEHLEKENEGLISEEDMESPLVEFLTKMRLPKKIKSIILYSIALADYDQENVETCKDLLKTKDGIDRLALYHSSIGRFNAQSAMLYPMYGQGELPQAFCRRAAVKGCIYVLRMPVAALLAEKGTGLFKGVKLKSGQDLLSSQLVIDPHFVVPPSLALSRHDASQESSQDPIPAAVKGKVARAICITRLSLKSDALNLLIVFPPRSLCPEQATSVRVLQLSGNVAVCPPGMFVMHLSTLCHDASKGKRLLTAAIDALFRETMPGNSETNCSENPEDTSASESDNMKVHNSALLWTALYIQEITEGSVQTISSGPSPDGNLSYNDLIDVTKKMFQQLYPGQEFFPEKASSEDPEDENSGGGYRGDNFSEKNGDGGDGGGGGNGNGNSVGVNPE